MMAPLGLAGDRPWAAAAAAANVGPIVGAAANVGAKNFSPLRNTAPAHISSITRRGGRRMRDTPRGMGAVDDGAIWIGRGAAMGGGSGEYGGGRECRGERFFAPTECGARAYIDENTARRAQRETRR
jgi:hypothetical protein